MPVPNGAVGVYADVQAGIFEALAERHESLSLHRGLAAGKCDAAAPPEERLHGNGLLQNVIGVGLLGLANGVDGVGVGTVKAFERATLKKDNVAYAGTVEGAHRFVAVYAESEFVAHDVCLLFDTKLWIYALTGKTACLEFCNFAIYQQNIMIKIKEEDVIRAAGEGMDAFVEVFVDGMKQAVGGELNAASMQQLTAEQITLWGYLIFREEMMDGGCVQLIHNGYGPFFFRNPFAKMLKFWGLEKLGKLVYDAAAVYRKVGAEIEKECTDEEFMALFEQYPQFEEFDDAFIEGEEEFTAGIARYVDEHIDLFAEIIK